MPTSVGNATPPGVDHKQTWRKEPAKNRQNRLNKPNPANQHTNSAQTLSDIQEVRPLA
ncbi:uncharacterized protein METZ01_LOCUS235478, partial [marine metagenome]